MTATRSLVALCVLVVCVGTVSAGTISVDPNDGACVSGSGQADPYGVVYCVIQDAIDDAVAGDVISLAPGVYDENIDIESRADLTIDGVDVDLVTLAPTTTIGWNVATYGTARQTVIRVVESTNIVFRNLTIDLAAVANNQRFGFLYWESGGELRDNVIKEMWAPDADGKYTEMGAYCRAPALYTDADRAQLIFDGNSFINCGRVAIVLHDFVNATITNNTFYKDVADFGYAIELGSAATGVIDNNVIYGFNTPAASDGSGAAGLYIENSFTWTITAPGLTKPVQISNNEIYNCQRGLAIGNEFAGYAGAVVMDITMTGNYIHDNDEAGVQVVDEGASAGSAILINCSDNRLANNGTAGYWVYTFGNGDITAAFERESIDGHQVGIYVADYASGATASSYDVAADHCVFTGNTYGVANEYAGTVVMAEENWWGDDTGPIDTNGVTEVDADSDCDAVVVGDLMNADGAGVIAGDNVDYCPWLPGEVTATLAPAQEWHVLGEQVVMTLAMSDSTAHAVGGQFFLAYDTSVLEFDRMDPIGGTFTEEIFEFVNPVAGTIDYAIGVAAGMNGTYDDTPVIELVFNTTTAFRTAETCFEAELVYFRNSYPATSFTRSDLMSAMETARNGLPAITIDGTNPVITCPADKVVECSESSEPAEMGVATGTDNCTAAPAITYSDVVADGVCDGGYVITRTWQAEDTGELKSTCDQTITVVDTTVPELTCPSSITLDAEPGMCTAVIDPGTATTSDLCETPVLTWERFDDGVTLDTPYHVGSTLVEWTSVDCSGNINSCDLTVTVLDAQKPSFECPDDITVHSDAGGTDAFVVVSSPINIADNCGIGNLVNDYTNTVNATDVYPAGTTTVTWTLTDLSGNTAVCSHDVTVTGYNELLVSVELSPAVSSPIDRCITFELYDCPGDTPTVVEDVLHFESGLSTALSLDASLLVPGGTYSCITARDKLHTLSRTETTDDSFRIVGNKWVADFTGNITMGGDWLVGGNLNDDEYIDILDYSIFSWQWASDYGTPDTACDTAWPHADMNADGVVTLADFTFIQMNFLEFAEDVCCDSRSAGAGPRDSISLRELRRMGLGHLSVADLNRDRVVDWNDIVEFANGNTPVQVIVEDVTSVRIGSDLSEPVR